MSRVRIGSLGLINEGPHPDARIGDKHLTAARGQEPEDVVVSKWLSPAEPWTSEELFHRLALGMAREHLEGIRR